jgi:hypothetical protein
MDKDTDTRTWTHGHGHTGMDTRTWTHGQGHRQHRHGHGAWTRTAGSTIPWLFLVLYFLQGSIHWKMEYQPMSFGGDIKRRREKGGKCKRKRKKGERKRKKGERKGRKGKEKRKKGERKRKKEKEKEIGGSKSIK